MTDHTNQVLFQLKNQYNIDRDEIYTLLNTGNSKITYKTVERWYSNPENKSYSKMQGHWLDLLMYRLKDKYGNKYFSDLKGPLFDE